MTKFSAEFSALTLKEQSETIKALRATYAHNRANQKAFLAKAKVFREAQKAERRAAAIVKAQARLDKLLAKQAAPVGVKALKANRKPSKVVTYGAEDNAIAAAIMAKKQSA